MADQNAASRVSAILENFLKCRANGEAMSESDLLEKHPRLATEIREGLRRIAIISSARSRAQKEHATQTVDLNDDTVEPEHASYHVKSSGLQVRCPSCHRNFSIGPEEAWNRLRCPGCNEYIRLTEEDAPALNENGQPCIANFDLLERVGRGGFGTVWKARDTMLDRIVAVKIPRRGRFLGEAEIENFLSEARVAAGFHHPGIVTVHEIGREDGTIYIVSDFVDGAPLATWVHGRDVSFDEAAALLATVADAVHAAHGKGVVHRDLKPHNIMMDAEGRPHVTDFGLARRESDDITATMEGGIVGTPAYMAPEQASGKGWVDRRSDVWSLGVILYELLTKELPFRGHARMLLRQIIEDSPVPPGKLIPSLPQDLETICLKCLEKEPRSRYASSLEFGKDIERFLRGEPVLARPISPVGRAWRWCKRRPLVPSLAVSLLITMVVAAFLGIQRFDAAIKTLNMELTDRALAGNRFTAEGVAQSAGDTLEVHYASVAEVVRQMKEVEGYARIIDEVHALPANSMLQNPKRLALHKNLESMVAENRSRAFAWFIQGAGGRQLARIPPLDGSTIGRSYAWRSYFHGGPEDLDPLDVGQPDSSWRSPALSSVFYTERTDQWVVCVSQPLWNDNALVGVVGKMISLEKLAQLPGRHDDTPNQDRFAVLMDSRTNPKGRILDHPVYTRSKRHERHRLLALSREPHMVAGWMPRRGDATYVDPFNGVDSVWDRRWIAARAPVLVHNESCGLEVQVQESHEDLIGSEIQKLSTSLYGTAMMLVLMAVLFLALAWIVLLRWLAR